MSKENDCHFLFLVFGKNVGYNLVKLEVHKMNNKGFSLMELMVVIVILVIITLLATSGYKMISMRMKETSYKNKINYIETKATEYANKTGQLNTNVDQLVKEGFINADDEDGHVVNPVDGSYMNCKVVYVTKENGNLYGNYIEDQEICNIDEIEKKSMFIEIKAFQMNGNDERMEEIQGNVWVRTNVLLEAEITDPKIDKNNVATIKWKSNAEEKETNSYEHKVKAEQIINSIYFVEIKLKDGTVYQAERQVKIDKQRPIIYDSETFVEKSGQWSNSKNVVIKASDGNGSGVYGYYLGTSSDCIHASYEESSSNVFEKKMNTVGTYYVCVRDQAGNVSEDTSTKSITIDQIDDVPPTCVWGGESTSWTSTDRTITLGCHDAESGCVINGSGIISKTYTDNITTEHWRYEIADQAGNITVCEKDVNIYIDKYPPSCWNNGELKLGKEAYNFANNIGVTWGYSGTGSVTCNPSNSLGTGVYTVNCSVLGNNGLTCDSAFTVKHNYPATYVPCSKTEDVRCNCVTKHDCCECGHHTCGLDGPNCGTEGCWPEASCCDCALRDCEECEICEVTRDCSYYICPNGGTLNETTCYY